MPRACAKKKKKPPICLSHDCFKTSHTHFVNKWALGAPRSHSQQFHSLSSSPGTTRPHPKQAWVSSSPSGTQARAPPPCKAWKVLITEQLGVPQPRTARQPRHYFRRDTGSRAWSAQPGVPGRRGRDTPSQCSLPTLVWATLCQTRMPHTRRSHLHPPIGTTQSHPSPRPTRWAHTKVRAA